MKITREMVERALAQHDKLVNLGVENTAQEDFYSLKGESVSPNFMSTDWDMYDVNPTDYLL